MAEAELTLVHVELMSKADLLNECERLGLSTSGTIHELRARLCSHLGFVNTAELETGARREDAELLPPSKEEGPSAGLGKSSSELLLLMNWMNEQNEKRFEQNEKRFEQMLALQREQMATLTDRLSPRSSLKGSDECSVRTVRRSVNRLKREAKVAMETMQHYLQEGEEKEVIKSSLSNLCRMQQRLETLLDQKVDGLDGDEEKDELLEEINYLQEQLRQVTLKAEVYVAKLERIESEKAKAGPLPPNVDIPKFDGNPVSFQSWWDHFRTLIHENVKVSQFWKMRYLLKALTGSAASLLAGKQGLADEYLESVEAVKKRYGSESLLVRHLVNSIVDYTPPSLKDLSSFGKFLEVMKTRLVSLEMHGATKDMILLPLLEAKLPVSIRKAWERRVCSIIDEEGCPSPNELLKFCESEHKALNSVASNSSGTVKQINGSQKRSENKPMSRHCTAQSLITEAGTSRSTKVKKMGEPSVCVSCNKPHSMISCSNFLSCTKEERRKLVAINKHCFKCIDVKFFAGHRCPYLKCADCNTPHHELLSCREKTETEGDQVPKSSKGLVVVSNEGEEILPTVLAKAVAGKKTVVVRLALDSMSQKTFVTNKTIQKLGIEPKQYSSIDVQGFGGKTSQEKVGSVQIKLLPLNGGHEEITIGAYVKRGPICAPLSAVPIDLQQCTHLKGLQLSDPNLPEGAEIDVLIGQAPFQQIISGEIVKPSAENQAYQPSAWKTIFGYALMGPVNNNKENESPSCLFASTRPIDSSSDCSFLSGVVQESDEPNLERFWNLEAMGIMDDHQEFSNEDIRAWNILKQKLSYDGERYSVPLPFKENAPVLKNNYLKVKRQLESTERRLAKNPKLCELYSKAMDDYVRLGFAREVTPEEAETFDKGESYFIPHHAVLRESSVSTKIRIVFNASDPDGNGNSLNSCLLAGPALQQDITAMLLRFRVHSIVLSGDIEKMFPQTMILPEYYRFQQYLWRNCNQEREPQRFVMTRLMFGVTSSPFCAMAAIQEHSKKEDMRTQYPAACEKVSDSLYVDDLLIGDDSEEKVVELLREMTAFFDKGGWHLTKFASNSRKVIEVVPEKDRHPHTVIELEKDSTSLTGALGLQWNPESDELFIKVSSRLSSMPEVVSKRTILSLISSIYDVFGFLAPYLIRAKILMQEIWKSKVGWDDPLPPQLKWQFCQWAEELDLIRSIAIPRFLFLSTPQPRFVEIHGFCDASEKAYGGVLYARYTDDQNRAHTVYILSKGRVAPLKSMSIARLELMGALVLAKLTKFVLLHLKIHVDKIQMWSDSKIVLAWIRKPSETWKQFVRNRVAQIHDYVGQDKWAHCSGKRNPADILSRGASLRKLKDNDLFWHGPDWLREDTCTLSEPVEIETHDSQLVFEEARVQVNVVKCEASTSEPPEVVSRSSSFNRTRRVVAWMLRWKERTKSTAATRRVTRGQIPKRPELSAKEIKRAEMIMLKNMQERHFSEDIAELQQNHRMPAKSKLIKLDPYFDQDGLLRVGGRLQNSDLPESSKHPIILPDKDHLTELIVKYFHEIGSHSTIETTMSMIRQQYYVIHLRTVVKRVLYRCLICRKHRTKAAEQKMGILPEERIIPSPAFSDVGLDFTGALHIREGEKTRKTYVCVFTCPHSRMIHLELPLNMTTEEFLQALRRFLNRRGWCRSIASDNQSTFQKSQKLLNITFASQMWKQFDKTKIDKFVSNQGIEWKFITERSPFRGAYWERMNRSLKEPLRKVLGNALLTYTELYTVLTDIEAVLNQRPLSYHSTDPFDPAPITPSELAIGRNLRELPPVQDSGKVTVSKRYKYLQKVLTHFWNRWSKEYLPKLQTRSKWQLEKRPLKLNDVVLITEENTSRPSWPLGRVVELYPSRDGLIRTVKLKTQKGYLVRPVQRLHLLQSDVETV